MNRISSFSVILIFVVLTVAGIGVIPLLNIQYRPSEKSSTISVRYSWNGASARVIEGEVTSILEGLISSVSGIKEINSTSRRDGGSITANFNKGTDMDAVRFEIASLIRRIYPKLPEEVTYPTISSASVSDRGVPIMDYTLNANLTTNKIEEYARNNIQTELSKIEGINTIDLYGATPFYIEISFDPDIIVTMGITGRDIHQAVDNFVGRKDVIGNVEGTTIILSINSGEEEMASIPVKNVGGRLIQLRDVATITYKERTPSSYYRINGLNTINISITPEKQINALELTNKIKSTMQTLSESFPENFSARVSYDESVEIKKELKKIVRRMVLSVIILLLCVYAFSRSMRYLMIIALSLLSNILIAFIFYYLFDLEIHIYSMAGITVSLGIVIDTSIIMIAHYGYYRNRKAFLAIFAALLTTIGTMAVVFILPESIKIILSEFAAVIMVNLTVSLLVALFLVPALIDKYPIRGVSDNRSIKSARRIIALNGVYEKYIVFARGHKWIFILLLVFGFGIPVHMLPAKLDSKYEGWNNTYNKTIGSSFYQNKMKSIVEKSLGGSLRLFMKNMNSYNWNREPQRKVLSIYSSLPDGCTVQQLNEVVMYMENYLTQFPQIDMFRTSVRSYRDASIQVTFLEEYENTVFPVLLKQEVMAKANDYGGANWRVSGIDDTYFNNNVGGSGYKSNRIEISGYNYDLLYMYCLNSGDSLSKNQRVKDPAVYGQVGFSSSLARNEYFLDYDRERMSGLSITPYDAYAMLFSKMYLSRIGNYFDGEERVDIDVVSSLRENYDVWSLGNEYIDAGGRLVKFSDIGSIDMRQTGNDIYKKDQQYTLVVAFDFIGPYELAKRVTEREMKRLNEEVLPIGFKAKITSYSYMQDSSKMIWALLLIIAIIYFICAILFESLIQPFIIIMIIPISFIGLFLTFYLTGFTFDQGGFAAFIMLSALSVNAGIYIMNQYNIITRSSKHDLSSIPTYIKAYNHKIIPIFLTVISTVLGLIPFLLDGKNETFWFAFAIGTMGGLLFSILGIVFYTPIWSGKYKRSK